MSTPEPEISKAKPAVSPVTGIELHEPLLDFSGSSQVAKPIEDIFDECPTDISALGEDEMVLAKVFKDGSEG